MDLTIIGPLIAGGGALLGAVATFASGYGGLKSRTRALESRVKHLESTFEKYVTREEFRSLERRFESLEGKIDRILEMMGKDRR